MSRSFKNNFEYLKKEVYLRLGNLIIGTMINIVAMRQIEKVYSELI
jgi:hypothetical protein